MTMNTNPTRAPNTATKTATVGGAAIVLATFLGKLAERQWPELVDIGVQEVVTAVAIWALLIGGNMVRNLGGGVLGKVLP